MLPCNKCHVTKSKDRAVGRRMERKGLGGSGYDGAQEQGDAAQKCSWKQPTISWS